jgi:serine/threonine-protein kinase
VLCQQVALHRAIGDGTQAYGITQPYVPPQPEVLPRTFGPYRLLEVLGRGGMGTVYLADDTRLGRRVALKMPRFDSARMGEASERFRREMRAAAVVRHPYLCPVYEVGRLDGVDYFTMPHVTGETLSARLAREGAPPQREAARLVQRIAEGMQAAHRVGVVHRDLKPSNVLLDEGGDPVVTDFGLARRLGPDDPRLTPSGATIGTAAYLPPEQIGCAPEAVGPRSDVYSLGVILYELLTGRPPFTGVGHEVLAKVLNTDPTPPSRLRARIDPRLEAACLKAMAKDPAGRFGSMGEFADAVRPVAEEVPAPALRRYAVLVAAVVVVVLAGLAIWFAVRP